MYSYNSYTFYKQINRRNAYLYKTIYSRRKRSPERFPFFAKPFKTAGYKPRAPVRYFQDLFLIKRTSIITEFRIIT